MAPRRPPRRPPNPRLPGSFVGPRPTVGARHLLRGFPSFINELWQQPCELGLGWRRELCEAGQARPLASRGLPSTAGRCSVLLLPAGHTPQCLSAQSQAHACGDKGSPSPPLGLGWASVTHAHDCPSTFSPVTNPSRSTVHQLPHTPVHTQTGRPCPSRTKAFQYRVCGGQSALSSPSFLSEADGRQGLSEPVPLSAWWRVRDRAGWVTALP